MDNIITLDEARAHLYIDDVAHDPWLSLFITAVTDTIALWVKEPKRLLNDSEDESSGYRPVVKAAALIELANHFERREGGGDDRGKYNNNYEYSLVLSNTATALLQPLRKPTVQ